MSPVSLIQDDGSLTPIACEVLHTVTGVPTHLLERVRIRKARDNWLHAPWYSYHRGGAITVGRTIWFTRKWFSPDGLGDGSIESLWRWLQHLAHEVGHLPQAERFGYGLIGKSRYVLAFAWQYGSRSVTFQRPVHDGALLELEADKGRWVLIQCLGDRPLAHPLLRALHQGDSDAVHAWSENHKDLLFELGQRYGRSVSDDRSKLA